MSSVAHIRYLGIIFDVSFLIVHVTKLTVLSFLSVPVGLKLDVSLAPIPPLNQVHEPITHIKAPLYFSIIFSTLLILYSISVLPTRMKQARSYSWTYTQQHIKDTKIRAGWSEGRPPPDLLINKFILLYHQSPEKVEDCLLKSQWLDQEDL